MKIVDIINDTLLNKFGAELVRYPRGDLKRRMSLLKHFQIDTVIDVGANKGGYGSLLRKLGFKGDIVSFEPLSEVFKKLKDNTDKDVKWKAFNYALGANNEESLINISKNTDSSSLLNMLSTHIESAPLSQYIGQEKIIVKKLDTIFQEFYQPTSKVLLKIDAQGYEKKVLDGAEGSLSKITGIQLEMSIIPLYENGMLYIEMIQFLKKNGFELYALENGFSDPITGQLLQMDGIFFRN
jgi:FkbM family methyltransferase